MSTPTQRVLLITGCSTGFGFSLASYFLKAGQIVVATARDVNKVKHFQDSHPQTALALALDVTDPSSVDAAVQKAFDTFGRIDVLINNAGYGQFGAFEELSNKDIRDQMDTNFFGVVAVTQRVLPIMRHQKRGHIIQISSMGGQVTFPAASVYHASKFAIEGLSESISKEVAPFNVKVTIVEPGGFKTDFSSRSLRATPLQHQEYEPSVGALLSMMAGVTGNEPGDPDKAAAAIHKVINSENPPLRLPLGPDALVLITKHIAEQSAELEKWREVSSSTNFDSLSAASQAIAQHLTSL